MFTLQLIHVNNTDYIILETSAHWSSQQDFLGYKVSVVNLKCFLFHFNFWFQFTCFSKRTIHNFCFYYLFSNRCICWNPLASTNNYLVFTLHLVHFHGNFMLVVSWFFSLSSTCLSFQSFHLAFMALIVCSSNFIIHYLLGLKISFIQLKITITYQL